MTGPIHMASSAGAPPHWRVPPSAWIQRFAPLVRAGGPVLDLACGGGRHLRHFHDRGHPVAGIDLDVRGVADLRGCAGVDIIQADLEGSGAGGVVWPLAAGRRFAGVVVANYLHRPLLPHILAVLEPGGVLLYETFALGNGRLGRPSSPDFLLRGGELLELARGRLQVVAYEHGEVTMPKPAIVQRMCAVNDLTAGAGLDGDPEPRLLPS